MGNFNRFRYSGYLGPSFASLGSLDRELEYGRLIVRHLLLSPLLAFSLIRRVLQEQHDNLSCLLNTELERDMVDLQRQLNFQDRAMNIQQRLLD